MFLGTEFFALSTELRTGVALMLEKIKDNFCWLIVCIGLWIEAKFKK